MKISINARFHLVYDAILAVTLGLAFFISEVSLEKMLTARVVGEMRGVLSVAGRLLDDAAANGPAGKAFALERARDLLLPVVRAADPRFRLTIIDTNGIVVADSDASRSQLFENHGQRSEIVEARKAGWGRSSRFSSTLGREMLYLARSSGLCTLRLARDLADVEHEVAAARGLVLAIGLVVVVVLAFANFFLAWSLTRPIRMLAAFARRYGHGTLDERMPVNRSDELGVLTATFNDMAARIEGLVGSLHDEKERLSSVLATMTEAIAVLDRSGRILLANENFRAAFSVGGDLTGRPYYEVIDSNALAAQIADVLASRMPVQSQLELVRLQETWVEAAILPIVAESGVLVVLRNITERKKYEKLKTEFVANASHELKTPLAIIDGYLQTLLSEPAPDAETAQRFIRRIAGNVTRLGTLVGDILSLNRLEEGADSFRRERVNPEKVLRRVVASLEPRARERDIRVEFAGQTGAAYVSGNRTLLDSLFYNLVDNAIGYSDAGGRVGIRCEPRGDALAVIVEDEGCGFTEEERERIFERFYRAETSRSRDRGGSGLGLSIVKYAVQFHGGTVTASSAGPGCGASFTVLLPLATGSVD